MIIKALTYRYYFLINVPKIHTELLWQLTFLFIGLVIIYFTAIFFFRNKISATGRKVKKRKTELSPMISEFLFYEDNGLKEDKSNYVTLKIEIRELLKNDFNRKVLTEILLDLQKDVSGDTQKRVFSLYQDLGLDKDAFEKLKSSKWQVISKGILELTNMQVVDSYMFIIKFINDRRSTLRQQAEIATVTLRPEGIAFFLDTTKYRISEWQQLKLLDAMRNLEGFSPPRFKLWLTSRNKHVVLFALKLVKYFNQNDCNASLIELLKHKNNQIREEAIKCIKEFNVVAARDILKLIFWKSNTVVKIAVLDAIAYLGNESDIEFLKKVENKEFNFSVKSKALSAINAISPESIMPTEGLQNLDMSKIPPEDSQEKEADKTEDSIALEDSVHADVAQAIVQLTEAAEEVAIEEPATEEVATEEVATEEEEEEEVSQSVMDMDIHEAEYVDASLVKEEKKTNVIAVSELSEEKTTESFDVNFLPLVSETEVVGDRLSERVETSTHYRPSKKIIKNDINDFEVVFEAVEYTEVSNELKNGLEANVVGSSDFLIVDFLPIIVNNQDVTLYNEAEREMSVANEVMAIEVIEEEILPCGQLTKEEPKLIFINEFPILEVSDIEVIEAEFLSEIEIADLNNNPEHKNLQQTTSKMKSTDQIKLKAIIEDLVAFESSDEIKEIIEEFDDVWPDMKWIEKSLDMEFVPLQKEESFNEVNEVSVEGVDDDLTQDKGTLIESISQSETFDVDTSESVLVDNSYNDDNSHNDDQSLKNAEEATMKLLDDIEALGDQREIPLLSELLQNEKYKSVKVRIRHLIAKFASMPFEERPNLIKSKTSEDIDFKPFNVFEDLFRTCDTAKKLILLDEIVAVGDEKEIPFLDSLLEDPNFKIREKAQLGLKGLMAKLVEKRESLENDEINNQSVCTIEQSEEIDGAVLLEYSLFLDEMEVEPPLNGDIFDVGFELSEKLELVEEVHLAIETPQDSFLNQLWSFPTKIIEKLNG